MPLSRLLAWQPAGLRDQCIALAGLHQALALVQDCARCGAPSHPDAMNAVLDGVLRIDAPSAEAVFGGVPALALGLESLAAHLARRMTVLRLEQSRYATSVMFLERRLAASAGARDRLARALQELVDARAADPAGGARPVERLAALYVEHVSGLGPRIMVSGEPVHLKTPANADRIRALLLAALRAAVLWRQCGGNQLVLTFARHALRRETGVLLDASH